MATITDNDLKMFQERARTELASGCDVGSIAWDSVIWDLCNEVRRLRSGSKELGNAAMLREALTKVKEWMERRIVTCGYEFSATFPTMLEDVVLPALAAPARNCDVGTVTERAERYHKFCRSNMCETCPAFRPEMSPTTDDVEAGGGSCIIKWEDFPYESEAAK